MTPLEQLRGLAQRVEQHPDLAFAGVAEAPQVMDSTITIGRRPDSEFGKWTGFEVLLSEVASHGAQRVVNCVLGREQPEVLTHQARVVGYFSNVKNWNRSKRAELRDRGRGDYRV